MRSSEPGRLDREAVHLASGALTGRRVVPSWSIRGSDMPTGARSMVDGLGSHSLFAHAARSVRGRTRHHSFAMAPRRLCAKPQYEFPSNWVRPHPTLSAARQQIGNPPRAVTADRDRAWFTRKHSITVTGLHSLTDGSAVIRHERVSVGVALQPIPAQQPVAWGQPQGRCLETDNP